MLGDAINRLIKFSLKSLKEKISYAHLMCGEYGLVHALINIFSFGYELYSQCSQDIIYLVFQVQVCSTVRPQPVRVGLLPEGDHGLQPVHRPPPPSLVGSQSGKHGLPPQLLFTDENFSIVKSFKVVKITSGKKSEVK